MNYFIFQQDGCGLHRAKPIKYYLDAKGIQLLPWPAQSSDLKPIENVWATTKKQIRNGLTHFSNKEDLFQRLCTICEQQPYDYSSTLTHSVPRRLADVRNNSGGPTKY